MPPGTAPTVEPKPAGTYPTDERLVRQLLLDRLDKYL